MRIKIGKLWGSVEGLTLLNKCSLPAVVSYNLAKLNAEIQDELTIIEKTRVELVKKYGVQQMEKDETGKEIPTDDFRIEDGSKNSYTFISEFKEILEQEIDIISLDNFKIRITDFNIDDEAKLPPYVFSQLNWLIFD